MKFNFSPRVTLICLPLIVLFLSLSRWQWHRHLEKIELAKSLEKRVQAEPLSTGELYSVKDYSELYFRRAKLEGSFDFEHEMILRNRKNEGLAGVHVLTPLKVPGEEVAILVSRGFIPLQYSKPEQRKQFQREPDISGTGLVKEPAYAHFLAPKDPESGKDRPWVDAWLRADIEEISKQLPYPLLPLVIELLPAEMEQKELASALIQDSKGKEELLMIATRAVPDVLEIGDLNQYPLPAFTTTLPAGRHLGYVYEWAFMALLTFLMGLLLQIKRDNNFRMNAPASDNAQNPGKKEMPG